MATLGAILFWGTALFGLMVAASFVGTTAALRRYFGDEGFDATDFVRIGSSDD